MTIEIFQAIETTMEAQINTVVADKATIIFTGLETIEKGGVTIWLLWESYLMMIGKSDYNFLSITGFYHHHFFTS